MGLFNRLFGRKKSETYDPVAALMSDDPIGATIRGLVRQQAEAAASGKRIINRFPESIRRSRLRVAIMKKLIVSDLEGLDIHPAVCQEIQGLDPSRPIGETDAQFAAISAKVPMPLLKKLEAEVRESDSRSNRPDYDDLDILLQ